MYCTITRRYWYIPSLHCGSATKALCCVRLFNEGTETCHASESTVHILGKFVKGFRGNMNLIRQINGFLCESGMATGTGFCCSMLQHRHSDLFLPRTSRPYVPSSLQTRGPLATSVCCKRPCDPCGCTKAKPTTQRRFCKWHLVQHFCPASGEGIRKKTLKFGREKKLGQVQACVQLATTLHHLIPFDIILFKARQAWTRKGLAWWLQGEDSITFLVALVRCCKASRGKSSGHSKTQ